MSKICSLFSGSTGNCIYVENKDVAILIDAGVSAKKITEALKEHDFDINKIKGVFVTHEHDDHISGVRVFCSKNNIPVFSTVGTYEGMCEKGAVNSKVETSIVSDITDMKDIGVGFFHTSHDTKESCGYVLDLGDKKIAVCTDLGIVTDEVHNALLGCDTVLIESNHDVKMLQNNEMYPFPLKRRIMSECGHLSNNACAQEIKLLLENGSTKFILAHLSRENNLPFLARETTKSMLEMCGHKETRDFLLSVAAPQGNDAIIL